MPAQLKGAAQSQVQWGRVVQWHHAGVNKQSTAVWKTTAQMDRVWGAWQSLFFIVLGSGMGKPSAGSSRPLVVVWVSRVVLCGNGRHLVFVPGPCRLNPQGASTFLPLSWQHTELSHGGEQLLCGKHLLFSYTFVTYIAAVTVCSLFQGCLLSVNCYLNPQSLPLSISYRKGQGEGEWRIWSLISSWCQTTTPSQVNFHMYHS